MLLFDCKFVNKRTVKLLSRPVYRPQSLHPIFSHVFYELHGRISGYMRYRVVSCGHPVCVVLALRQKLNYMILFMFVFFACRDGILTVVEDQPRLCVGVCVCVCVCVR